VGRAAHAVILALVMVVVAVPGAAGEQTWQDDYERARAMMIEGDFAEAGRLFDALAASASRDVDRAVAAQNASLCREWTRRGAVMRFGEQGGEVTAGSHSGRRTTGELASLYIGSIAYGVGSGIALVPFTDPGSAAELILPMLGLAGGSAGVVYLLDSSFELDYGVPQSISAGLSIGLFEGLAWTFWHYSSVRSEDEWSDKTIAALLWGSTTAGAVIGGVVGDRVGTSPGRAAFIETAARWTGLTVALASAALPGSDSKKDDAGFLGGAIGLTVGAAAGYFLGEEHSPSVARSRFVDLGGIAGGLVGGGLYLSAAGQSSEARPMLLSTASGIAVGVGLSWYLTRDMEQDPARRGAMAAGLTPVLVPTSDGAGMTFGLGGTM